MDDLIIKLAKGESISNEDIEHGLYEICDRVHSSCDSDCPVYELQSKEEKENLDHCSTFKNGKNMLAFIKEKSGKDFCVDALIEVTDGGHKGQKFVITKILDRGDSTLDFFEAKDALTGYGGFKFDSACAKRIGMAKIELD